MKIKQGDIFLVDLSPAMGHEQDGFRPVLVLQNNVLNKNLNTVIVAPISANMKAKGLLTTYYLSRDISQLDKDSVVLLFQIRTLDQGRLKRKISNIDFEMISIKKQFKFIF